MKYLAKKDKEEFNFSDKELERLLSGIYEGNTTPLHLPQNLYEAIANELLGGVEKGFGDISTSIEFGLRDIELISALQENVYMFSAAKTFQQTLEMSEALVNEVGDLRSFKEFKNVANEIFVKYNGGVLDGQIKPGWLEAEYNTAIAQAGNAKKWKDIEQNKHLFPYLKRNEVEDLHECHICQSVNNVTLPVDHPFWKTHSGCLHFNCRGFVEQLELEEGKENVWAEEQVAKAVEKSAMPDAFKYNPGQSGEVFSTEGVSKHPYFSVPKEYADLAKRNFDLPLPIKT